MWRWNADGSFTKKIERFQEPPAMAPSPGPALFAGQKYIVVSATKGNDDRIKVLLDSLNGKWEPSNIIICYNKEDDETAPSTGVNNGIYFCRFDKDFKDYIGYFGVSSITVAKPGVDDEDKVQLVKDEDVCLLLTENCKVTDDFLLKLDEMVQIWFQNKFDIMWCNRSGNTVISLFNNKIPKLINKDWLDLKELQVSHINMIKNAESLSKGYSKDHSYVIGFDRPYSSNKNEALVLNYPDIAVNQYVYLNEGQEKSSSQNNKMSAPEVTPFDPLAQPPAPPPSVPRINPPPPV